MWSGAPTIGGPTAHDGMGIPPAQAGGIKSSCGSSLAPIRLHAWRGKRLPRLSLPVNAGPFRLPIRVQELEVFSDGTVILLVLACHAYEIRLGLRPGDLADSHG